jgi:transglutaminase-like putative cysteine protease
MRLFIEHTTHYTYGKPATYSIQQLRLWPRQDASQTVVEWQMDAPGKLSRHIDAYGNITHIMTLSEPHQNLAIRVKGVVDVHGLLETPHLQSTPQDYATTNHLSPWVFMVPTPLTVSNGDIQQWVKQQLGITQASVHPIYLLSALMNAVYETVSYVPGSTNVHSSAIDAFNQRTGVCQDMAHLMIACCRALALPARYVSGYLYTGDSGHLASHAWVDVWDAEKQFWHSIDPTHNQYTDDRYCRLAVGRDYTSASPLSGIRQGGGSDEQLDVMVMVAQQ